MKAANLPADFEEANEALHGLGDSSSKSFVDFMVSGGEDGGGGGGGGRREKGSKSLLPRFLADPWDERESALELFQQVLQERKTGAGSKKFKNFREFSTKVSKLLYTLAQEGQLGPYKAWMDLMLFIQSLDEMYGWTAAHAYFWALQRLVEQGEHELTDGPIHPILLVEHQSQWPSKRGGGSSSTSRRDATKKCCKHGVGHSDAECWLQHPELKPPNKGKK
jgi:hypothetical protein